MKKVILMLAMLISVMQLSAQSISYDDVSTSQEEFDTLKSEMSELIKY